MSQDTKVIAFYLPQFHATPENDEWWGKGFTEWTNVKNAKPLYEGHDQPKVPLNENYYNLLDDDVKKWQVQIAKENGVYGFCFYHYWFGGKLMLHKPLEQYLDNKNLDLPFCFCWANPPWTKVWMGQSSTILIDQDYGDKDQWEEHFQYLLPFLKDDRYIKEAGCPLFVIYMPDQIPCLEEMLSYYRERAIEEGFKGIKLAYQYWVDDATDGRIRPLFDYCIKFQPIYALQKLEGSGKTGALVGLLKKMDKLFYKAFKVAPSDKMLRVRKSDYDKVWETILSEPVKPKDIPCAFVDFDNTPRRGQSGKLMVGASPEKFEKYLRQLIIKGREKCQTDYVFMTAWNEWSEGAYLEPDTEDGYGYLNAIRRIVRGNEL